MGWENIDILTTECIIIYIRLNGLCVYQHSLRLYNDAVIFGFRLVRQTSVNGVQYIVRYIEDNGRIYPKFAAPCGVEIVALYALVRSLEVLKRDCKYEPTRLLASFRSCVI